MEQSGITTIETDNATIHIFSTSSDYRKWLEKYHDTERELWIGYYKKGIPKQSMSYQEAVKESLCFGWIDGVLKSLGTEAYANRFTPRKPRSIWSNVNIGYVEQLIKEGKMTPAGMKAYEAREKERSGIYAFEQVTQPELSEEFAQRFKSNSKAWEFFEKQTPSYKKTAIWHAMSAKREETREKRLRELITDSEARSKIKLLRNE